MQEAPLRPRKGNPAGVVSLQESAARGETTPSADELELVAALRRRDELAFSQLVDRHHSSLLRLARLYVRTQAVAEEVVQETWLGVLQGIDRFEGRSSLKTWIFHILMNRARTRGQRESRSIPFSAMWDEQAEGPAPAVEPERFQGAHGEYPDHWAVPPRDWGRSPEEIALSGETRSLILRAIEGLPPSQREVITLRDIEQWNSDEVCNVLKLTETNQRVLLHRARSAVRRALERHFGGRPVIG